MKLKFSSFWENTRVSTTKKRCVVDCVLVDSETVTAQNWACVPLVAASSPPISLPSRANEVTELLQDSTKGVLAFFCEESVESRGCHLPLIQNGWILFAQKDKLMPEPNPDLPSYRVKTKQLATHEQLKWKAVKENVVQTCLIFFHVN